MLTKDELKEKWKEQGLAEQDHGLSVSKFLGYKYSGSLRQILTWDFLNLDVKENYRLRDPKYSEIIAKVLKKL